MKTESKIEVVESLAECILDEVAEYKVSKGIGNKLKTLQYIDDLIDTIRAETKAIYRAVEGQGAVFI